jgi:hypothetical protein
MLDALKFVQGAVAKKDYVQALTHFHIADGFIKGYNGSLALCSPIDLNLEIVPKAQPFIKAIQTCKDTVQLNMTPAGRLSIKSGGFKAFVDCLDEKPMDIAPEGQLVQLDGNLLKALKILNPFIAEDASRPWARGIMFRGPSAFATNNVTLVEYWLGYTFPVEVNIPKPAVQELLRIGEEPISIQLCENSVSFHFEGGRWLRTQTYSTQWPDMGKVLNREGAPVPLPAGFFEALTDLAPFTDELERVFFLGARMATTPADGLGASTDLEGLPDQGIYHIKQLQLLEGIAHKIDLAQYPAPCLFYGDKLRGAIVGMRG